MLVNTDVEGDEAKREFETIALPPISLKYILDYNYRINEKLAESDTDLVLRNLFDRYIVKHRLNCKNPDKLCTDDLLIPCAKFPKRGLSTTKQLFPKHHLNFKLTYNQLALLNFAQETERTVYQFVFNLTGSALKNAHAIADTPCNNTTVIREILRSLMHKLPRDVVLWGVLELGKKNKNYHIHLIAALNDSEYKLVKQGLFEFKDLKSTKYTRIGDELLPIDMGASHYFAKDVNSRHFGCNNIFTSPKLNELSRQEVTRFKSFVKKNKPFILTRDKSHLYTNEDYG